MIFNVKPIVSYKGYLDMRNRRLLVDKQTYSLVCLFTSGRESEFLIKVYIHFTLRDEDNIVIIKIILKPHSRGLSMYINLYFWYFIHMLIKCTLILLINILIFI